MFRLTSFLLLTIYIFPSDCQSRLIVKQKLSLCVNDSYTIPLFTTRMLPITLNRSQLNQLSIHTVHIHTFISNRNVAEFYGHLYSIENVFYLRNTTKDYHNQSLIAFNLKIYAKYINQTDIHYFIQTINIKNQTHRVNCSLVLIVSQPLRLRDKIFKYSIPITIVLISIVMGVLIDRKLLKELIRQPIQVFIGFFCQYGFMPMIAFSITKIFRYNPLYGLALFVVGCCPGGAASSQWTIIFEGDIDLSALMSFVSIITSFFMMPLWLYTLGQYAYLDELKLRIPYFNLAQSLVTINVPIGIGMLLHYFIPKLQPFIKRILKPIMIVLLCYFFIFGSFVHFYLLPYVDLTTTLTASLLPWLGFLLGGFFAWICKQDWKRILTIGIETGIQNYSIAFMVLLYSLPSPENSQAVIIPFIVAFLSTQPFNVIFLYQLVCTKCFNKPKPACHMSIDTISKTTRHLGEEGNAELIDVLTQATQTHMPTVISSSSKDLNPL